MADEKLGRRDFLKLTVATVAAQGLSHFRFLNFSGIGAVSAHDADSSSPQSPTCTGDDVCDPSGAQDTCDLPGQTDFCVPPQDVDSCLPVDPDVCGMPTGSPDVCDPLGDADECSPPVFPEDVCMPPEDPDICDPPNSPEDICDPLDISPDTTSVKMTSMGGKSSGVSLFGGVLAFVAGAALWVRQRLMVSESEED